MADLLVIGSGSLARGICCSFAVCGTEPAHVVVFARSAQQTHEICYIANARAALTGRPAKFTPERRDITSAGSIAEVISARQPRVIVNCASLQSPWEGARSPSGWTAFLQEAGFGVTLPLQSAISREVALAISRHSASSLFVNGCYPDAVNPLLQALGLPVTCGIGNIALVAASLQAALGLSDQARLRVLAHHLHLHLPADGHGEARAWLGERPVANVQALLSAQRAAARQELNTVTCHAAALVLDTFLTGGERHSHLPGPRGLPGGYPVLVRGHRIELALPAGITLSDAVDWNQQMAERDGVVVSRRGAVSFGARARAALARHLPHLADGFPASRSDDACSDLLRLRDLLRETAPAPGVTGAA